MSNQRDRPGVIGPPPLIYLASLILGLVLNWGAPTGFLPDGLRLGIGLPIIVAGVFLAAWAFLTFQRAGTSPDVYEATKVVVVVGPFRYSRNPIYLSFAVTYLGIASAFNALWSILLFPVALLAMHYGVIVQEERYLERKFGEEYLRYKRKVRRWL
ncbi:MAG: isoprenylcysteine carboxylmethyltransferase family protein [Thaumarchaeota archaeon]|nr:isoprenylcysteine carboxylmethyltransferase family protein [Nitrososphaerota archaeon]